MNGKWNSNTESLLTENQLKNAHLHVTWHKPHAASTPSTSSTPTVVTMKPPVLPSSVTSNQKKYLLDLMKYPKPVTPGWGGAKVFKQLEDIKKKIADKPEFSGLTDRELLKLMDDIAEHKTAKTYESVVVDWLNTPAGKKYAGGGPDILDTPKPGAVIPTPASTPTIPGTSPNEIFDGMINDDMYDVVDDGIPVKYDKILAIAENAPNDSTIAVSMKGDGTLVRIVMKNDEMYYQVFNETNQKWDTVSEIIDENMLNSYQKAGNLFPWKVPKNSKLPTSSAHVPTPTKTTPVKTTPVKTTLGKKAAKKAAAQQAQQSASLVSHFEPDALLNDTSTIDSLSSSLQTEIFTSFKDKAAGSYLNSSPEEIFSHLASTLQELQKTAQYKNLTPMQLLRVIDAQSAKKFGVANDKLFEKKITEWLKTPAGKQHANDIFTGKKAILPKVKKVAKKVPSYMTPSYTPPTPVSYAKPGTPELTDATKNAKPTSTRSYENIYGVEVKQMQQEMFNQQGDWTAAQKSSLRTYTGASYSSMNNCLRGKGPCTEQTMKHIKNAQAGMRRSTRNIVLRRGTNADEFPGFARHASLAELKSLEGREITADSFLSSSFGDRAAFGGNVLIEFDVPAGTPMAYVKDISQYSSENEILLGAGLRYEVTSVTQLNAHQTLVKVRVIVP